MSCVDVIFSNHTLPLVCGEQPIVLVTAWIIWIFQWDPFGQELPVLNSSFGDKMVSWDSVFPITGQFHLDHLHICVYFEKLLLC